MDPNFFINFFTIEGFEWLIQLLVTVLIGFYNIFAFIVVRQVKTLNDSLSTDAGFLLSIIAYINMFASVVLLIVAIVSL